jgi:radical SAM protein with 4Fe4S-binding SPASM domain
MGRELYLLLLQQLVQLGFSGEINFHFYAEPLLNKRLAWFSAQAKEQLPKSTIVLYTNGDFLSAARYRQLRESGVDVFYVTRHDDDVPDWLLPLLAERDVVLDYGSKIKLNNRGGYLGPPKDPRVHSFPCVYPSLAIIVTIDGNILPCSCDFDEKMSFGNIKERSLHEIWNSERAVSFRRSVLAGHRSQYDLCRNCDYYSSEIEGYDFETRRAAQERPQ